MHEGRSHHAFIIAVTGTVFVFLFLLYGFGRSTFVSSHTDAVQQAVQERDRRLTEGNVALTARQLASYGQIGQCIFLDDRETLSLTLTMPDIPGSDDAFIYLLAFEPYESYGIIRQSDRGPVAYTEKSRACEFRWHYEEDQLFQQFVPALLVDGVYVPLSSGMYINNPEMIAKNRDDYPKTRSKKGLLLDPQMVGTPYLEELNLQHAIYNIPLSLIVGETTDDRFPTISYPYKGKEYQFDGAVIASYDYLFDYLSDNEILATAIILNDWDEEHPELIHPLARNENADAYYYAFNTAQEEGCLYLEAIASFLTDRYAGDGHGLVSSWVIANEINQNKTWNYMDTDDIVLYAAEFEKALRIFYTAAKRNYAGAKVYFSVDHEWNDSDNDNTDHFNGKELIESINSIARQKGNYDWGLAIHPYPDPLTRVNYWTESYDKSMDAPLLTLMNLSTTTDFMSQEEYLDRDGDVRSITVTELGFTSASGEKLQAAAFAYCYYIIDANPYVEAFMMNRQTDAPEELRQGLAFGIYERDRTSKYIREVFRYIDTDEADRYTDFMLNIVGADSLEEALSWAQ